MAHVPARHGAHGLPFGLVCHVMDLKCLKPLGNMAAISIVLSLGQNQIAFAWWSVIPGSAATGRVQRCLWECGRPRAAAHYLNDLSPLGLSFLLWKMGITVVPLSWEWA